MNEATIALTVMTSIIFLVFLGFLVWGWRSGQFKNIEEAKHAMMDDETQTGADKPATSSKSRRAPAHRGGHKV